MGTKELEVRWTPRARESLREVVAYWTLGEGARPAKGQRIARELITSCDGLGRHAEALGTVIEHPAPFPIRRGMTSDYWVYYRIRKKRGRVEILDVYHQARRPWLG